MNELDAIAWPTLDNAARHGLLGEVLHLIEPQTEADPAALALTLLAAFGSAVGAGPYILADGAKHRANLFLVVVGDSARARKGTSARHILNLLRVADPDWEQYHVRRGLSSGEGLIKAVSDGETDKDGQIVGAIEDKRLFVIEEEFSSVLTVKGRDGNTLSERIREAFDSGNLSTMTRHGLTATGAHISILGHITIEELRRCLTDTDRANGCANRFLFAAARRSRILPNGGSIDQAALLGLGSQLSLALAKARTAGEVRRSAEAEDEWARWYTAIAESEEDGIAAALLARAEAHVLRLSLIYALLDGSPTIELAHVRAAEAVWDYCAQSVRFAFADFLGDSVADRVLAAIRDAGDGGMDSTQQHSMFSRHVSRERLALVREQLQERGLIEVRKVGTGGREKTVSVAALFAHNAQFTEEKHARNAIKRASHPYRDTTTYDDIAPLQSPTSSSNGAKSAKSVERPQPDAHSLIQQAREQGVDA